MGPMIARALPGCLARATQEFARQFQDSRQNIKMAASCCRLACCRTQESLFTSWTQPLQNEGLRAKELLTSTDSLQRKTGTTHIIQKSRAIRRAPCLQASALSANFWSCSLTLAGGPRSNKARGGGRRSSISLIRVALENITYKCSHQTSSSISVSAPVGGKRAQSIVTLAAGVHNLGSAILTKS